MKLIGLLSVFIASGDQKKFHFRAGQYSGAGPGQQEKIAGGFWTRCWYQKGFI